MEATNLFQLQLGQLIDEFPKFEKIVTSEGVVIARGTIDVVDTTGKLWESYQVEIHPSDGFPYRFPSVYEIGGKIPRIGDWHVYEDTQSCCIAVEPEERLICKDGITLTAFIKNHVLPYFFNQTHRKVEGYYKNGEYAHGLKGVYEFYDEILQTKGNVRETIRLMIAIADNTEPGRTHDCFCGSSEKYRRCHRTAFRKLKPLGKAVLYDDANDFTKAVTKS